MNRWKNVQINGKTKERREKVRTITLSMKNRKRKINSKNNVKVKKRSRKAFRFFSWTPHKIMLDVFNEIPKVKRVQKVRTWIHADNHVFT